MGHYLSDVQDDLSECPYCGNMTERSGLYHAICLCDGWQLSHKTWVGMHKFRHLFTDDEYSVLVRERFDDKAMKLRKSADKKIKKALKVISPKG